VKKALIGLAVITILIQFIPDNKTNPPVLADLDAPGDIKAVFRKSCYDCHSNETVWPWYSNIVPVSLLVVQDVEEGRRHFNFSEWGNLSRKDKAKLKEEIWEEVEKDNMPLGKYTFLHPDSKLDQNDKELIKSWTGQ
jgi:hypothetical protein